MPGARSLDTLTVDDVAELLHMPRRTVLVMASRREIPMFKLAGTWRISADTFSEWLRDREALGPRRPVTSR